MANPLLSPGIVSPQSVYEVLSVTHTDQERPVGAHPVGTRAYFPDGRVFYYALVGDTTYGTAVTRGQLLAATNPSVSTAAGCVNKALNAAVAAGSNVFTFVPATVDVVPNFFADGYLYVNDATGEGLMFKVRSHTKADVSASDVMTVVTYDPTPTALTTSSEVTIIRNLYDRVGSATDLAELVVGVSLTSASASTVPATDVAVAAVSATSNFVWVQTWGPCPVLQSDTTARGGVMTATATDGTIAVNSTAGTSTIIGTQITLGVASEYRAVDLKIRP